MTLIRNFFFLAPRLVEFPTATLNRLLLFLVQNPYTEGWMQLNWGAMRDELLNAVALMGFVTGGDVPGYIDLSNYVTLGEFIPIAEKAHEHINKPDLDKLGADENGYLLINGTKAKAGDSDALGGRPAADHWHKDNANKNVVDWTMLNGIVAGNISSEQFVSDSSGWRIGLNADGVSRGEMDRLTIRESLFAKEFIINQTRAFNGNMIVANSARLESIQSTVFLNSPDHKIDLPDDIFYFPFCIALRLKIPDKTAIQSILELPFITVKKENDFIRISTNHVIKLSDIPENAFFDLYINYVSADVAQAIIGEVDVTYFSEGVITAGSDAMIGNDHDGNNTVMYVRNPLVVSDDYAKANFIKYGGNYIAIGYPVGFPISLY